MNDARLCVTWKQRFQGNNYRKPPTKGDNSRTGSPPSRCAARNAASIVEAFQIGGGAVRPDDEVSESSCGQLKADHVRAPCTLSFNLVGGGVPPKEGHSSLLCVYMTYTQSVSFLRIWGRQLSFLALLLMAICLPPFLLKGRDLSDVLHVYQYQALDFSLYSFRWQESRSEFSYILSYIIFMWFLI